MPTLWFIELFILLEKGTLRFSQLSEKDEGVGLGGGRTPTGSARRFFLPPQEDGEGAVWRKETVPHSSSNIFTPMSSTHARTKRGNKNPACCPDSRSTPNLLKVLAETVNASRGDGSGHVFASVSSSWFAVVIVVPLASQPGFMHARASTQTLSLSHSLTHTQTHARQHH